MMKRKGNSFLTQTKVRKLIIAVANKNAKRYKLNEADTLLLQQYALSLYGWR